MTASNKAIKPSSDYKCGFQCLELQSTFWKTQPERLTDSLGAPSASHQAPEEGLRKPYYCKILFSKYTLAIWRPLGLYTLAVIILHEIASNIFVSKASFLHREHYLYEQFQILTNTFAFINATNSFLNINTTCFLSGQLVAIINRFHYLLVSKQTKKMLNTHFNWIIQIIQFSAKLCRTENVWRVSRTNETIMSLLPRTTIHLWQTQLLHFPPSPLIIESQNVRGWKGPLWVI